jgi:hypothetical protein
MIGTLPSCQSFWKKVSVFDQATGRLIGLSSLRPDGGSEQQPLHAVPEIPPALD